MNSNLCKIEKLYISEGLKIFITNTSETPIIITKIITYINNKKVNIFKYISQNEFVKYYRFSYLDKRKQNISINILESRPLIECVSHAHGTNYNQGEPDQGIKFIFPNLKIKIYYHDPNKNIYICEYILDLNEKNA